jgi:hypothetical protein
MFEHILSLEHILYSGNRQTQGVAWGYLNRDDGPVLALAASPGYSGLNFYIFTPFDAAEVEYQFEGFGGANLAWADYDLDGDLDIAVGAYNGWNAVFENLRDRVDVDFADPAAWVSPIENDRTKYLAWGDWNNDGYPELAVGNAAYDISRPDHNNVQVYGNTEGELSREPVWGDSEGEETHITQVDWGDFDGDGFLDLIAAAATGSAETIIYRNEEGDDGNRTLVENARLTAGCNLSAAWGDWDGDGDLDVALGFNPGCGGGSSTVRIYQNHGPRGGGVWVWTPAWDSPESDVDGTDVTWGDCNLGVP